MSAYTHTDTMNSGSYLPLTHVQQGGPVTSSPGQFALEQFAVKKAPGTAVFPWQRLAADIIDEQRCVNASHKERGQLHTTGIHFLHLTDTHKCRITAFFRFSKCRLPETSSREARRRNSAEELWIVKSWTHGMWAHITSCLLWDKMWCVKPFVAY